MSGQANCVINLEDVYVNEVEFRRSDDYHHEKDYDFTLKPEFLVDENDENSIKVSIKVIINEPASTTLYIKFILSGIFTVSETYSLPDDQKTMIINRNTLAILYPYVRSFLTTITAQSGVDPIILPVLNINAVLNNTGELNE